jgi:putative membrane protein
MNQETEKPNNKIPDREYLATIKAATDYLAKDRTVLANERTLLAYIRTGLMLLGSGITFSKMFHDDTAVVRLGWVLTSLSVPVFLFSIYRFRSVSKHLNSRYDHK